MIETMYHDNGVGLAAIQVGHNKRLLVIDPREEVPEFPKSRFPIAIINPEIIEKSDTMSVFDEGCLSVPGIRVEVSRPEKITVKFLNIDGIEEVVACAGWFARILQHEIDHLDGKLLIDYVSSVKKDIILRRLAKEKRAK
jgi:peptide deformylase